VQIDLNNLSLEQWLLILLLAYVLAFALAGLTKGRKYLKTYSSGKKGEYFFHSVEVTLTLAGLSITSLALFIGLGIDNLNRFSSIILFFSISFVVLALSSNFARFPRRFYTFIADILADVGILAIACGFLVFFVNELSPSYGLILTYGIFIIVFIFLSGLDLYKYYKYWLLFGKKEKEN
jgi:hypothetical protein